MTIKEREMANERIDKMIGSREWMREAAETYKDLAERIKFRDQYNKMREKLMKIAEKEGVEALAMVFIENGRSNTGVTIKGKNFEWYGNNGFCERSRYCGSLWIEGIGTVFTSGTIAKAVEYIINN